MSIRLKIFLIIMIVLNLILILKSLNLKKISIRYGVFWILLLVILALSVCFSGIYNSISSFLGFETTSNMLFLLGFFFFFYLNFLLITKISILSEKIKNLIQEISILKQRVDKNERK